jgi:hypothetical protein
MSLLKWLPAAVTAVVAGYLFCGPALAGDLLKTFSSSSETSAAVVDHAIWRRLLEAHVVRGSDGVNRVAYARMKESAHDELKRYIASLEGVDIAKLRRSEQFAFWANLYNAKTVDIVLQNYPVDSIKDINLSGGLVAAVKGGPWSAKVVKVAGHDLSLDDIEHGIMRRLFKDPRVHYAVNCASIGCPNLPVEPFAGERLEQQLEKAAHDFINSPRGAKVVDGRIQASSIYSWFQADFGGNAEGVVRHLRRYAEPALKASLDKADSSRIDYDYDWRLNDAK